MLALSIVNNSEHDSPFERHTNLKRFMKSVKYQTITFTIRKPLLSVRTDVDIKRLLKQIYLTMNIECETGLVNF